MKVIIYLLKCVGWGILLFCLMYVIYIAPHFIHNIKRVYLLKKIARLEHVERLNYLGERYHWDMSSYFRKLYADELQTEMLVRYKHNRDLHESRLIADKILAVFPDNFETYNTLAVLSAQQGDYKNAIHYLNIALNKVDAVMRYDDEYFKFLPYQELRKNIYNNLMHCYICQNEFPNAYVTLRSLVEIDGLSHWFTVDMTNLVYISSATITNENTKRFLDYVISKN